MELLAFVMALLCFVVLLPALVIGQAAWYAWWLSAPVLWVTGYMVPFWTMASAIVVVQTIVHQAQKSPKESAESAGMLYFARIIGPIVTFYTVRWMMGQ